MKLRSNIFSGEASAVESRARLKGRAHEAQPLQRLRIENAVTAVGAPHRVQQPAQQVIAHHVHADAGLFG